MLRMTTAADICLPCSKGYSVRFISHNLLYNDATKEGCPMQWILLILAAALQLGGYYYGQGGQDNV